MMTITGKTVGSRRPLFADWSIPIPPVDDDGDGGLTLGELIERIVRAQVASFRDRQQDRRFIRALSAEEILQQAEQGKIEMGESEIDVQEVDEDLAVDNALQAFEDGIYLVIIDETPQKDLNQRVYLTEDSQITFIRLTMLSGG